MRPGCWGAGSDGPWSAHLYTGITTATAASRPSNQGERWTAYCEHTDLGVSAHVQTDLRATTRLPNEKRRVINADKHDKKEKKDKLDVLKMWHQFRNPGSHLQFNFTKHVSFNFQFFKGKRCAYSWYDSGNNITTAWLAYRNDCHPEIMNSMITGIR